MVKLSKSTADRAAVIICAAFVLQQRRALQEDQEATYVDLPDLQEYAEQCAIGYNNRLAACKDFADMEILHRAVEQQLNINSNAYEQAFKPKKGKRK